MNIQFVCGIIIGHFYTNPSYSRLALRCEPLQLDVVTCVSPEELDVKVLKSVLQRILYVPLNRSNITNHSDMSDLIKLGERLLEDGPVKTDTTPRRIRGLFQGQWIFDTLQAVYVWEWVGYPYFYIPIKEFKDGILSRLESEDVEGKGKGKGFYVARLSVGDESTDRVLVFEKGELGGLVRVEHAAISWFAEDEKLLGPHPKDPYKRVETFPTSRTIRIEVDGTVIAVSSQNVFLYETMLRPRYYLNPTNVRYEFLTESETTSYCPYKGMANYYNITLKSGKEIKDAIWYYRYPTSESALVANRLCFYNEKVDVFVDGVAEEKYESPMVLPSS